MIKVVSSNIRVILRLSLSKGEFPIMKLILQLATMTAEYTLSGVPAMRYEGDCVYIIDNNNVTVEVPEQKPVVVPAEVTTEPVAPELPVEVAKEVTPSHTPLAPKPEPAVVANKGESADNIIIQRMYKFIESDEMKQIRDALKDKLKDGDIDNITAAIELATRSCISPNWRRRNTFKIESVVIACMFLVAGYNYSEMMSILLNIKSPTGVRVSYYVMNSIITPEVSNNYEFYETVHSLLESYLKCERGKIHEARLNMKSHFDDILDAMRAGYTNAAIQRKYKYTFSNSTISRIRNGCHPLSPAGEAYPIPSSKDPYASTVKCCKYCGCAIPVARVSATKGKADTCIDCKNKLEKEEKLRKVNG